MVPCDESRLGGCPALCCRGPPLKDVKIRLTLFLNVTLSFDSISINTAFGKFPIKSNPIILNRAPPSLSVGRNPRLREARPLVDAVDALGQVGQVATGRRVQRRQPVRHVDQAGDRFCDF